MKVWCKRARSVFRTAGRSATLAVATALLFLCSCQDSLAIKDFVQQRVQDAQTMLRISDDANGSAIPPGGTVQWPATIFTYNNTKTFRLTNHGASSVTLSGSTPVGINGGTGQAEYVNIVVR